MTDKAGLYLHIPFCEKKCAYCDFYSSFYSKQLAEEYITALKREIIKWGGRFDRPIDTVYLGGGTPSLIGDGICGLLDEVRNSFSVCDGAEITVEINPASASEIFLASAKKAGVNRLSIGVQSGNDAALLKLGRIHTSRDAVNTVKKAREYGFSNISVDLMISLPDEDEHTLQNDIDFICSLDPEHISAYILKIEPNTKFYNDKTLCLPDEEEQAKQYLQVCKALSKHGYRHYEISNFAKPGFESRHNMKYWKLGEYLGLGPSAHSYVSGKRFFYSKNIKDYIRCPQEIADGLGGTAEERLMLSLRLSDGAELPEKMTAAAKDFIFKLESSGLAELSGNRLRLSDSGMLVSNSIITELTELLYENV